MISAGGMKAVMSGVFRELWNYDEAQDVAEYAMMLAVVLAIAIGAIRLIGFHTSTIFANLGSAIR